MTLDKQKLCISVVLVNYNTRALTLRCLSHLYADIGNLPHEVFLVDNGSTDGSIEAIKAQFPAVIVVAVGRNIGFGAANNLAMPRTSGKYIFLLNSDAFIRPSALGAMIKSLRKNPRMGVIGPRLLNSDGSLQISCFPFPTPLRAWAENLWLPRVLPDWSRLSDYRRWMHDEEQLVDWVVGACLLIRREVYQAVGEFDERFMMYSEETDWQRRARDKGWQVGFTPHAQVVHLGGASGVNDVAQINSRFFNSLDEYSRKHHGISGLLLLRAAMVLGCTLRAGGWLLVWLSSPKRRPRAASKLTLHVWLLTRQLFSWDVLKAHGVPQ